MKRLFPKRAKGDAPKKPRYDVFLALVALCAHIGKPWVVVTQKKLLERIQGTSGHRMARRSLNRHLGALEDAHVINRVQRHIREPGSGKFKPRATLYTFALQAPLWIKRLRDAGRFPLGRHRVPKMAHSRYPVVNQGCPLCGQIVHRAKSKSRPPLARGQAWTPEKHPGPRRANGHAHPAMQAQPARQGQKRKARATPPGARRGL